MMSAILARYGEEGAGILRKYNPDYLFRNQLDDKECFMDEHPTLISLSKKYDKKFPSAWVMAQLHDLSEFCGSSKKLTGHALQQCANVISMEFGFLKVSELLLFFQCFKAGKYGVFYGSVDPLVITSALRMFCKDRATSLNRYEQEERERKEEESKKNAETWEQYCKRNGIVGRPHPLARKPEKPADTKKKELDEKRLKMAIESAECIISNSNNLSENNLKLIRKMFKDKHKCEPEEFIKNHKI